MSGYQRSYATARSVSSVLEIVAWFVVAIGIVAAMIGFFSGNPTGVTEFSRTPTVGARILSAAPGLGISISGLFMIVSVQFVQATVDTAEMTRDLLDLAILRDKRDLKKEAPIASSNLTASKPVRKTEATADRKTPPPLTAPPQKTKAGSKSFNGYEIKWGDNGIYHVDGKKFSSISHAETHVNRMMRGI